MAEAQRKKQNTGVSSQESGVKKGKKIMAEVQRHRGKSRRQESVVSSQESVGAGLKPARTEVRRKEKGRHKGTEAQRGKSRRQE